MHGNAIITEEHEE